MRQTLFCFLALVGTAAASHDICVFMDHSDPFKHRVAVTLNVIGNPRIMDQWGEHSSTASIYTFKNDRGRVDVASGTLKGWSAAFDGVDWGGFVWHHDEEIGFAKRLKWGCYPTTNKNYCNVAAAVAMFNKCVEKHWNKS